MATMMMKNIRKIILIVILANSFGCLNSIKTLDGQSNNDVKGVRFLNLDCIELSENYKRLSSQNDEILVLYYLLKDGNNIIEKRRSEFLNFDKQTESIILDEQIKIPDKSDKYTLKVILIEYDTNRDENDIQELVSLNVTKSKEELTEILLDDDVLGIEEIDILKWKTNELNAVKFWGIHLFDEYEYKLYFMTI